MTWELWRKYAWGRAYQVSLKGRPKHYRYRSSLTYGETPRPVMKKIRRWSQIGSEDLFLELGSGTGHFSLWLSLISQCQSIGIEFVPQFVESANFIAKKHSINAQFLVADLFEYPWGSADLIYLTATCFKEEQMEEVAKKCEELKSGARLVVLTYSLDVKSLELCEMWVEDFSWGSSTLFLYKKIDVEISSEEIESIDSEK